MDGSHRAVPDPVLGLVGRETGITRRKHPAARCFGCSSLMSVRIAILGASGAVGSALAVHLLRGRLLEPGDRTLVSA